MINTTENDILFDDASMIEAMLGDEYLNSVVKTDCDCSN